MYAKAVVRSLVPAFAALVALAALPARASTYCGTTCLRGFVDRYIAAMVAHDPQRLPLAHRVEFTENGVQLRLGDGLWGTASAPGHYKIYITDPEDGQVGFYGTVFENGVPVLLALRLKIDYGLISQIETIVARPPAIGRSALPSAGAVLEKRGQPRPQFLEVIPPNERMSHDALVNVANSYFTGLGGNTGLHTAPFWPTCNRWENGSQTTNNPRRGRTGFDVVALGCSAQQKSGFFSFVTDIRNRRFPVVDREHGLVMSFCYFDHEGIEKTIHLTNGETVPSPVRAPLTLEVSELFQIHGGKIDQIEAVLNTAPYGMKSAVWDAPWVPEQPDTPTP